MEESDKILIKQVLNSRGWSLVEQMLQDEANEAKKIKTDGKRYEDIAVEAIANEKVSKAIKSLLRKLYVIKNDIKVTTTVYK